MAGLDKRQEWKMYSGKYDFLSQRGVYFGRPAAEAAGDMVSEYGAERVLVVSTPSLSRRADVAKQIADRLGGACLGVFDDIVEHAPLPNILELSKRVGKDKPDLLLSVGGGSVIDTVKVALLAVAGDAKTADQVLGLRVSVAEDGSVTVPQVADLPVRQAAIPTTLSGAEFGSIGGAVDPERGVKDGYANPGFCAVSVIYDPELARLTPNDLWTSTGIRAVDHAVETILSKTAQPFTDGGALHALRLFSGSLQAGKQSGMDADALQLCQFAVWLSTVGLGRVPYGASHGIGHQLGAVAGVPHGLCSCVLLPAVLRYNAAEAGERDGWISEALGSPGEPSADAVLKLIRRLGLADNLEAVGVEKSQFEAIAEASMPNLFVRNNLRPLTHKDQIIEILESAWSPAATGSGG